MQLIDRIRQRAIEQGADIAADTPVRVRRVLIASKSIDVEQRLVQGIATTTDVDMDGEVIVPNFDMGYFDAARTVYVGHDYSRPVGTCRNYSQKSDGLFTTTYITRTALGEEVLTMIDEGIIRGLSIGIIPLDQGPPNTDEITKYGDCHNIIRRSQLLEYSITAMPANPGALIEAMSKNKCRRATAVALGLDDTPERKFHPVTVLPVRKKLCIVSG
jgi:HK97 family phage prohead protease